MLEIIFIIYCTGFTLCAGFLFYVFMTDQWFDEDADDFRNGWRVGGHLLLSLVFVIVWPFTVYILWQMFGSLRQMR